jgi:ceramide glucosyltransferase
MLMKSESLAKIGGFRGVADHLAEDYILGSRFHAAGLKVTLSHHALRVVNTGHGFGSFWKRHVRWGQMRRHISPLSYSAELVSNPTPFLLCAALMADGYLSGALGCALLLKWGAESATIVHFAGPRNPLAFALLPLRDLLLVPIWFTALLRRTVEWRGNRMKVTAQSVLVTASVSGKVHDRPAIGFSEQLQS